MSFYRSMIAAVAALGLATTVFAADATTPVDSSQAVATATTTTTTTTDTTTTAVNINTATAEELAKVKGLTAAKAKAIVSYRKKHGDFKSLDNLKEVKGFKKMSPKTMEKVQGQLTVG